MAAITSIAALCCLYGCGNRQTTDTGIPRPVAYPRPVIYDPLYTSAGLPADFEVNASATVTDAGKSATSENQPVWVDITYPAYGATLHCTFTPVDDEASREKAMDNRLERMALNVGDNMAEQTELTSPGGFTTIILSTMGRTLTPLQFLSVGDCWVISGAMRFHAEAVETDSVRPLIDAVKTDIIHAAENIR